MMSNEIVVINNLYKSYGDIVALNDVNLIIRKGVEGLIGHNGAGKTTLISILLGLRKANKGDISFFGFDPWREGYKIRKRVGVMHEKTYFPKNFTGREYLEYVCYFYGYDSVTVKRRVRELIDIIGLEEYIDRKIGSYSAGMLQHLGLAQALIGYPEFVILDEPTSNLDPVSRAMFLKLVERLYREEKINFLISTHVLAELERVCRYVHIIRKGKVIEEGLLMELAKKYVNEYTIICSDPVKLFDRLSSVLGRDNILLDENKIHLTTDNWPELEKTVLSIALEENIVINFLGPRHGFLEQIYRRVMD